MTDAIAGENNTFVVQLRDEFQNDIISPDSDVLEASLYDAETSYELYPPTFFFFFEFRLDRSVLTTYLSTERSCYGAILLAQGITNQT